MTDLLVFWGSLLFGIVNALFCAAFLLIGEYAVAALNGTMAAWSFSQVIRD